MLAQNVPSHAQKIEFQTMGGKKAMYYVWHDAISWYWAALGNCGQQWTEKAASEAAKRWIKDSQ